MNVVVLKENYYVSVKIFYVIRNYVFDVVFYKVMCLKIV